MAIITNMDEAINKLNKSFSIYTCLSEELKNDEKIKSIYVKEVKEEKEEKVNVNTLNIVKVFFVEDTNNPKYREKPETLK